MYIQRLARLVLRVLMLAFASYTVVSWMRSTIPHLAMTRFDDAYMFLRYAKHVLAGNGASWNIDGGRTYGLTSTLHLLTVTAVRRFTTLPDPVVLTASSFGAGLVSVFALVVLGFVVVGGELRRTWSALLVIPGVLLVGGLFSYHSLSGMETTSSLLCNALLALAVVVYCRQPSGVRMALCVLAGYVTVLARPDNGVYALLFPPLFFIASDRRLMKRAAIYACVICAVLALDLVIKKAAFGDVLPLPFYAKRTGFYLGYLGAYKWNAAGYMLDFLAAGLPFITVVTFTITRRSVFTVLAILAPMVITFGYFSTVNQVMGTDARYYYPSLPFIILAALVAAEDLRRTWPDALRAPVLLVIRLACASGLYFLLTSVPLHTAAIDWWRQHWIGEPTAFAADRQYVVPPGPPLPALGWWPSILAIQSLVTDMPSGVTLAASEYGYVGAELPATDIIDLIGLQDRHIAHTGVSALYVFSRQPDILWLPHKDYSYLSKDILDSDTFARQYDYYPDAYDYGIAVYRGSPQYTALTSILTRDFARAYGSLDISAYRAIPVER